MSKKALLMILDGWGLGDHGKDASCLHADYSDIRTPVGSFFCYLQENKVVLIKNRLFRKQLQLCIA
jgi:bisphosphoglycerate-independent phosphoglycerate mutase (AlkP superfamily)